MRELDSSSEDSEDEAGFLQRYSKKALKAREEERMIHRGRDLNHRPSSEARDCTGPSSAPLSSISADVGLLSALTPPPPRLRLPSDIDCESPRPFCESPSPYSVISPTFSHPSNCSSSSYLDSVPSLVSAPYHFAFPPRRAPGRQRHHLPQWGECADSTAAPAHRRLHSDHPDCSSGSCLDLSCPGVHVSTLS
ncbi:hypothetical protein DFH06DRAFT_443046 [Mycena polygramma]|nr:hypothetical protein DFH06DRAFT_443046 [Mycena polygramma]